MKRQLAAILHADVAGYSRLTGKDEEETHRKLDAGLNLLTDVIEAHGGKKLNEAGDAILAEFNSVTEAVTAAFEFQGQMSEKNAGFTKDERFQFRIGVNLGEVIHDRDDIYGDGVNLAARIQELANPGGVCVSGAVFDQISGGTDQKFDDLGYKKLKNIAQPVRVYETKFSEAHAGGEIPAGSLFGFATQKRQPLATGGCLCGNVRYETWAEPLGAGFCHCRFCKLAVGAPVTDWVCFEEKFVSFLGDAPKIYRSSPINERAFCGNCGTSLYSYFGTVDASDFYYGIRLATLDNPEDFPPMSHGCVESQLPWLDIHDGLPRIRTEDDDGLSARWAAVGQPKTGITLGTAVERLHSAQKD